LAPARTGQLRRGKVIAKHPAQVMAFEEALRRGRKIPDVSAEAAETSGDRTKPQDPSPEPSRPAGPSGFALGDRVSFDDGNATNLASAWSMCTGST